MSKLCLAPVSVKGAEKAAMDTQEWLPLTSLVGGGGVARGEWLRPFMDLRLPCFHKDSGQHQPD